jgi:hypothetical protein
MPNWLRYDPQVVDEVVDELPIDDGIEDVGAGLLEEVIARQLRQFK